jgi:UDP-N-acetylglucosamine 2-epimerase (non-hydrolysing)
MISCVNVVGARPNFMKIAPLQAAMQKSGRFATHLVHTGQHYDVEMSDVFFRDLGLPIPDVSLEIGSGTHAQQTASAMLKLELVLSQIAPNLVVVVGDVNSTLAAALTATKMGIAVAHVEAGLRSRDWTMPEEINRVVTDVLSSLLFAPSDDAVANLRNEGIPAERIHLVGNIMIDSLQLSLEHADRSDVVQQLGLVPARYFVSTLHRPSNVDDPKLLQRVVEILISVAKLLPVVLVAHPRTAQRIKDAGAAAKLAAGRVRVIQPLGHFDFLRLVRDSTAVLTDSGGIQEETTVMGIPCITLRDRTERPITVFLGTNRVTGLDVDAVLVAARDAMGRVKEYALPPLWDGHTAERIVRVLIEHFANS